MDQPKKRVLVVDDDHEICTLISEVLRDDGYDVTSCHNGESALALLQHEYFDLLLSDIKMSRVSGVELLVYIRQRNLDTKVILITAYASVQTAVQAVRGAAYDYLVKPFALSELRQSVRQALEYNSERTRGMITIEDVIVDLNARQVWVGDRPVDLTPREFDVLVYLAKNKGRTVSWEELIRNVWKYEPDKQTAGTLRSCIRRLRTRLDDDASSPKYIENIWGVGYRANAGDLTPPLQD